MTSPRRLLSFRLSRCNRTGLVLWLGVGLLVLLMASLPGRRSPPPSAEFAGKEGPTQSTRSPRELTGASAPNSGIVRASATR